MPRAAVSGRTPGRHPFRRPANPTRSDRKSAIAPTDKKNNAKPKPPDLNSPDSFVTLYSHFLLFWVILGFIVSYCIVLGIGWGTLLLKIVAYIVASDPLSAEENPFSMLLRHRIAVIWVFIASLISYAFFNLTYDCLQGYRLKRELKRFFLGSLVMLLLLSALVVSLFFAIRQTA